MPQNIYRWASSTIENILENQQYTGCTVNGKSSTISYKVEIYFTAVGLFTVPQEQELLQMMEEIRKEKEISSKTA